MTQNIPASSYVTDIFNDVAASNCAAMGLYETLLFISANQYEALSYVVKAHLSANGVALPKSQPNFTYIYKSKKHSVKI